MLEIIDADFNDPDHGRQVLAMLNEYASGPMGGNTPLPAHAQANLIPELARRPTVRALLARIDGQAAGVAIYVEGFSTFACRPLLNLHDLAVSPRFQGQGVGKQLLAWYLSTAAVVSAYGAAGSLVVLLMWIYFSSAVLLFSASCARAFQEHGALRPDGGR